MAVLIAHLGKRCAARVPQGTTAAREPRPRQLALLEAIAL